MAFMLLIKHWWKTLAVIILFYTVIGGFLIDVPRLDILNETIRNQFFHVPMWFAMMIIMTVSVVYAIRYLRSSNMDHDHTSVEFANIGIAFGVFGILTGSFWLRFTWTTQNDWWVNDPKLNGAAVCLLIYLAYAVLRGSFSDSQQRARISAVYNIFAFATLIPLLYILPRLTDSLHPGNGGNPGFVVYDLDSNLRMVFYPAVIGWTLLGIWIASLKIRLRKLSDKGEFYA